MLYKLVNKFKSFINDIRLLIYIDKVFERFNYRNMMIERQKFHHIYMVDKKKKDTFMSIAGFHHFLSNNKNILDAYLSRADISNSSPVILHGVAYYKNLKEHVSRDIADYTCAQGTEYNNIRKYNKEEYDKVLKNARTMVDKIESAYII